MINPCALIVSDRLLSLTALRRELDKASQDCVIMMGHTYLCSHCFRPPTFTYSLAEGARQGQSGLHDNDGSSLLMLSLFQIAHLHMQPGGGGLDKARQNLEMAEKAAPSEDEVKGKVARARGKINRKNVSKVGGQDAEDLKATGMCLGRLLITIKGIWTVHLGLSTRKEKHCRRESCGRMYGDSHEFCAFPDDFGC